MQQVQELQQSGESLAVYDVPLLYERGMEAIMLSGVAVVWVPQHIQLVRLMARDKIDEAAAQRIDSQWSLDEKRDKADWVIDNSGTMEQTAKQVQTLITELKADKNSA